jgi:hypothetical protein
VSSDEHRDVVRRCIRRSGVRTRWRPWLVDPELTIATDEHTVRDRAAASLVIVFGQHIEDVAVTDEVVAIRLGKTEFALPLDEPMRQLAAASGKDLTASHPNSNRVFRGYSPGSHFHGSSLWSRGSGRVATDRARALVNLFTRANLC